MVLGERSPGKRKRGKHNKIPGIIECLRETTKIKYKKKIKAYSKIQKKQKLVSKKVNHGIQLIFKVNQTHNNILIIFYDLIKWGYNFTGIWTRGYKRLCKKLKLINLSWREAKRFCLKLSQYWRRCGI